MTNCPMASLGLLSSVSGPAYPQTNPRILCMVLELVGQTCAALSLFLQALSFDMHNSLQQ
jgi:hypothetical protein